MRRRVLTGADGEKASLLSGFGVPATKSPGRGQARPRTRWPYDCIRRLSGVLRLPIELAADRARLRPLLVAHRRAVDAQPRRACRGDTDRGVPLLAELRDQQSRGLALGAPDAPGSPPGSLELPFRRMDLRSPGKGASRGQTHAQTHAVGGRLAPATIGRQPHQAGAVNDELAPVQKLRDDGHLKVRLHGIETDRRLGPHTHEDDRWRSQLAAGQGRRRVQIGELVQRVCSAEPGVWVLQAGSARQNNVRSSLTMTWTCLSIGGVHQARKGRVSAPASP
jgi:hypothetical protein